MKKLMLVAVLAIAFVVSAFGQLTFHRFGAVAGEPELFGVVGLDLFEFSPGSDFWAELATYTTFNAEKSFGGPGVRKDWEQATYTVSAGAGLVVPLGAGWARIDDIGFGANLGVRF